MNGLSKRNCPNCSAPYDINFNKCPYCGTSYYDLSALDFTTQEPFYLKIKSEINGMPCYITQLVRPKIGLSMEFSNESVDIQSRNKTRSFVRNNSLITNIQFEAIASTTHNHLCTIEIEEQ